MRQVWQALAEAGCSSTEKPTCFFAPYALLPWISLKQSNSGHREVWLGDAQGQGGHNGGGGCSDVASPQGHWEPRIALPGVLRKAPPGGFLMAGVYWGVCSVKKSLAPGARRPGYATGSTGSDKILSINMSFIAR